MIDAVTATDIPRGADLVAGYIDGPRSQWGADDWARFPGVTLVRIATNPATNDGIVLDVEPGDASVDDVPAWLALRRAAGVDPTVYCSASVQLLVAAACQAAGTVEPHYWIADWDGDPTLPEGVVAKQYMSTVLVDYSSVADYWPGVDTPTPPLSEQEMGFAVQSYLYPDVAGHDANGERYTWAGRADGRERVYTLRVTPTS